MALCGCQMFEQSRSWSVIMHSRQWFRANDPQGLNYAHSLQRQLAANGVEAHVVTFRYGGGGAFTRSAVVYKNEKTPHLPWWLMDSTLARPVWLPNGTLERQIRFAEELPAVEIIGAENTTPITSPNREFAAWTATDWDQLFQRRNGTSFDPQSSADREKMAELKQSRQ